ncbi:MAG: aminoglycoside phosphotransferase family protein, partial [Planctomycetes bacterium]|nr:aminoglycoside phosphotransferase family protein [Planctomycetota bacterium]
MNQDESIITTATTEAEAVLASLGLESDGRHLRPSSGHNSSLLLPCTGEGGREFLLKYFVPPTEGKYYPAGVRIADYARREGAFYRFLDSTDPDRLILPAPKTIVLDSADPPSWILLEWIEPAAGPREESLSSYHVFDLLERLRRIPLDQLLGRRDFPLSRWDTVSYLERIRLMYEDVSERVGGERWRRTMDFFTDATRWTESRPPTVVHGDFTEQNIMVDADGAPFLVDFERIGVG